MNYRTSIVGSNWPTAAAAPVADMEQAPTRGAGRRWKCASTAAARATPMARSRSWSWNFGDGTSAQGCDGQKYPRLHPAGPLLRQAHGDRRLRERATRSSARWRSPPRPPPGRHRLRELGPEFIRGRPRRRWEPAERARRPWRPIPASPVAWKSDRREHRDPSPGSHPSPARERHRSPARLRARARGSRSWCVERSRGRVRAVFDRRGRAVLALTSARGHGNSGDLEDEARVACARPTRFGASSLAASSVPARGAAC